MISSPSSSQSARIYPPCMSIRSGLDVRDPSRTGPGS
jgi:hypothetical protein